MNSKSIVIMSIVAVIVVYLFTRSSRKMKYPVKGRITSKFGLRTSPTPGASTGHNGIDIAVPIGTPVESPLDGTVQKAYSNSAGGNQMIVKHTNGYTTGYAHLSAFKKAIGDKVKQGDTIALTGNTGITTGPHLHFTVRDPKNNLIDPLTVLS